MSADMPAFGTALWAGFQAGKLPRPEYLIPCLFSESGINPAAQNSIGCQGINQLCPFAWPIPAGYTSWTASQQLLGPVTAMFAQIIAKYGPLNSGTRTYLANFLPAYLSTAKSLTSVLAVKGSAVYNANAGFDYQHTGQITVGDLAYFIGKAAANPTVKALIAAVYAMAPPGVGPEQDPVYGTDYPNPNAPPQPNALSLIPSLTAGEWVLVVGGAGALALGISALVWPAKTAAILRKVLPV
jgi:hypothetical protein